MPTSWSVLILFLYASVDLGVSVVKLFLGIFHHRDTEECTQRHGEKLLGHHRLLHEVDPEHSAKMALVTISFLNDNERN